MSLKEWEKKVLERPGAEKRVGVIESEMRLATRLTALREEAGVSQRELAGRIGVSQPRIAAIERSRNVTLDVLENYAAGLGGRLEVSIVQGRRRTYLLKGPAMPVPAIQTAPTPPKAKALPASRSTSRRPAAKRRPA